MDDGGEYGQHRCARESAAANKRRASGASNPEGLGMSQLLHAARVAMAMAMVLVIVILALSAAGATSAASEEHDCTWGASSVAAWVDGDGTLHQTAPATSGCIP
jgi:hypothetical protein